jgi:hypothetical protein
MASACKWELRLFGAAEKVFWDFRDTESVYRAHFAVDGRNAPVRSPSPKGRKSMTMENDMTSKITAILAAAVVLASAGVASAQTNRHAVAQWQTPYYNQDTGNLRFGHTNDPVFDVYGGTR